MLSEPAPAKLNLALHVRRRREDGFHELETIFAFLRDGDVVRGEIAGEDRFEIEGPFADGLASAGDNLVTRALAGFRATFGGSEPVSLVLDKRLPVASGIGGGSADAAATLRLLARLFGVEADHRLFGIAAALGSDVPACLAGGTTLGTGRGEALLPIAALADMPVLLVNPGVAVSTAQVFAAWDGVDRGGLPDGGTFARARAGRNDLQPPAITIAPVIGDVLDELSSCPGVALARMSGSGATCFALFEDEACLHAASEAIAARRPNWWRLASGLA